MMTYLQSRVNAKVPGELWLAGGVNTFKVLTMSAQGSTSEISLQARKAANPDDDAYAYSVTDCDSQIGLKVSFVAAEDGTGKVEVANGTGILDCFSVQDIAGAKAAYAKVATDLPVQKFALAYDPQEGYICSLATPGKVVGQYTLDGFESNSQARGRGVVSDVRFWSQLFHGLDNSGQQDTDPRKGEVHASVYSDGGRVKHDVLSSFDPGSGDIRSFVELRSAFRATGVPRRVDWSQHSYWTDHQGRENYRVQDLHATQVVIDRKQGIVTVLSDQLPKG